MFTNVTIEIAGKHRQGCPLPLLRPHQDLEERVALQLRLQLQLLLLAKGAEGGGGERLETAIELNGSPKVVERVARAPLIIIANF